MGTITGKCDRCQKYTQNFICEEPKEGLRYAFLCATCRELPWDESVTRTVLTSKGLQNRPAMIKAWDKASKWLDNKLNPPRTEAEVYDEDGRLLRHIVNGRVIYDSGKLGQLGLGGRAQTSRPPIPKKVKMYVWQRDGGRCVECGSKERLEYDHIIPVSKGGSHTERNLQLLCEKCNRSKGASI